MASTCRHGGAKRVLWTDSEAMCEAGGGNMVQNSARHCLPESPLIFQSPLNEAVHKLRRTNQRAQNLDAIWAPHALAQVFHKGECVPAQFHTHDLPMWSWIPAVQGK